MTKKVYDVLKKYYYATQVIIKGCAEEKGEIRELTPTMFNIKFEQSSSPIFYKGEVGKVPYYLAHFRAVYSEYYEDKLMIFVEE